ncbi:glucose inhibited division A family protein, partial [Vibrio parahaemolyticus V-223/04]
KTVLFTAQSKILKRSKRVRRRVNQAWLSVAVC